MKNFAAIDFETANSNRSSVCSVGIVIVRDGVIVERLYSLIRPIPNDYSWFCVKVHGLTHKDTFNAVDFKGVWEHIAPKIAGLPLIAHNSRFDEGCLKAAYEAYGMPYPDYKFHCTCVASRKKFGKMLIDHKLPTVSAHCGFQLSNHHNAIADAEACAHIALSVFDK